MANVSIIGSGFAGLSSACFMAKAGHDVTVFEKNATIGGRARAYTTQGFTFDMGPSWYWMPDTFERFFNAFGKSTSDYYDLVRLDPGFQMIFSKDDVMTVPADMNAIEAEFERIEPGSAAKLRQFLSEARYKYDVGMGDMVYKPALSWLEFMTPRVIAGATKLDMFSSVSRHVRKYFKDPRLVALMEFPVLFLGATAANIPALYSLMNYSALVQGTWYPMRGMAEIVYAMQSLAKDMGVRFKTRSEVVRIDVRDNKADHIHTADGVWATDAIIATGDYHHIESKLLEDQYRNYKEEYWEKRTFAPSCLIFYIGVSKRIKRLIHHNLFFDTSLDKHADEIYTRPQWPSDPLFYVCCPSRTDPSVAPAGMENLFILIPVAPGLEDTEQVREQYFNIVMSRIEYLCEDDIQQYVVYKKSYSVNDFVNDYNAYKGNAYGLANTLRQTAVFKPSLKNSKVNNLYYAGQLTVPGPGVPPSLISGQLAAEQLMKTLK